MKRSENLNVMVYGGAGAREHALMKIANRSPLVRTIYCTVPNAGIDQLPKVVLAGKFADFEEVATYCSRNQINLVIIGPEMPLAEGLADVLRNHGIPVFGPGAMAAQLEACKSWAVEFMKRHGILTAETRVYNSYASAHRQLSLRTVWPVVVKDDGLRGGKGVTICHSLRDASTALQKIYANNYGAYVLLQEFLPDNPMMVRSEISVHVIVSGDGSYQILPSVQDYKPRFDGDTGPMTGGMGCFSPVPEVDMDRIEREIIQPTILGLRHERIGGYRYCGIIYFGLKLCPDGPRMVEYNVRAGDPEIVALAESVESDLMPLFLDAAHGRDISKTEIKVFDGGVVGVVVVNMAYPGKSEACVFPKGLDTPNTYHAATTRLENGSVLADGGRIAVVTARGDTVASARDAVYSQIRQVNLGSLDCRRDIAAGISH